MHQPTAEHHWLRLARRSALKVNLGWWWQSWVPVAVFTSLVGFTVVFYLRSTGVEAELRAAWPWLLGGFAAAGLVAWWIARPRYTDCDTALVRLESKLGLDNALSAARVGVAPWPEVPARPGDGLSWRARWLLAPPLLAAGLFLTAFVVPVTPPEEFESAAPAEPGAWSRIEDAVERLEDNGLAEPEDLSRVRDQVQQLRAGPQKDWFSADSLEASASLEGAFNAGLTRMGRDLARADQNLGQLAKFGSQMSARAQARAAEEFEAALKNLEAGKIKPNQALMRMLKDIDPGALQALPPEQLQALRDRLQKNADALRRIRGRAGAEEGEFGEGESGPGGEGGEGRPGGEEGEGGNGGLNEGPGHAPLNLGDRTDLETDKLEGVESSDLERAASGDLLEEIDSGHEVDRTEVAPRAGGAIRSPGQGGDTVTRDQLVPSEKALLRKYFE